MAKSPSMSPAELLRVLEAHGFEFVRAKGSHHILKNRSNGKMTVVPMHKGDLPKGTLLAILRQAGINKTEL